MNMMTHLTPLPGANPNNIVMIVKTAEPNLFYFIVKR